MQAKWYQLEFVMLVLPISFTTFCVPQEKQNVPNTLLHVTCLTQYIPHILAFKSPTIIIYGHIIYAIYV